MEPTKKTNDSDHAPKKMTFAQNVTLTIKILTIAALILVALWGLSEWTSPT